MQILDYYIYEIKSQHEANTILEDEKGGSDFCHNHYSEPGHYFIHRYQERCPRNCCWDQYCNLEPLDKLVKILKKTIQTKKKLVQYYEAGLKEVENVVGRTSKGVEKTTN